MIISAQDIADTQAKIDELRAAREAVSLEIERVRLETLEPLRAQASVLSQQIRALEANMPVAKLPGQVSTLKLG